VRRFLARRLAHGAAVIFIAASLSFLLVHLAPGDPFSATLDSASISPSVKAGWRAAYGLDRPLLEQYVRFLGQLARGDLGPSLLQPGPASAALADAVPNTLVLMGTALVLTFIIGIGVGSWQAARVGSRADRVVGNASLIVASLPEFWLAAVFLLLFVYRFRVFPAAGVVDLVMHDSLSFTGRVIDRLRHLALPALTLGLLGSASIARYQRAALLDVLPQDFIRTARAKGVTDRFVLWRHALRNALVPTIVLAGLSLPTLLGGAVFVEQVFSWPGLGRLAAAAVHARDYQVVIGATIMGAVLVVAGGILADLLHAAVDPRVRAQ
jgi:peptide/nickel transport system permease protein